MSRRGRRVTQNPSNGGTGEKENSNVNFRIAVVFTVAAVAALAGLAWFGRFVREPVFK